VITRGRAPRNARLGGRLGWLRRARARAVAALCGIGLALGLWYAVPPALQAFTTHPYFALTPIEIDGNRRLTRREILDWVGVHDGSSIWYASPGAMRVRLQSHPWIQRVSVQREFPRHVSITVQERRPVAIVRLDGLNYVDRSGRVLGPLRPDDSRDFPLITGLEGPEAEQFAAIGMRRGLQLLRLCERLGGFDTISEVHVDRSRGVTLFPQRPAVAVVLGWGEWREKLMRSTRVFAAWTGQVNRLAAVDMTFRDQVVVKLREEPRPAGRAKRGLRV